MENEPVIYPSFILGFIIYTILAFMSYSKPWQAHKSYWPLGIAIGIISNLLWMFIPKYVSDPSKLIKIGLYWDVMMTGCFLLVPIFFFELKLTPYNWLGILLIVAGIVLTKV